MRKLALVLSSFLIVAFLAPCVVFADDVKVYHIYKETDMRHPDDVSLYLLENDITFESAWAVNGNITIDLQGHNIQGASEGYMELFVVRDGGSLTIKNSTDRDRGTLYVTKLYEFYEQLIRVEKGGNFFLEGGTLKGNADEDCRLVTVNGGHFAMHGGKLCQNKFDGKGGAVYVTDSGSFSMRGGTISDIDATDGRGAVYINGSTFNLYDGRITKNTSEGPAAGVVINDSKSKFNMSGGEISHNTNTSSSNDGMHAGGVAVDEGEFKMTGGSITGNSTNAYGGGVYLDGSSDYPLAMDDGLITDNKARKGGGLYLSDGYASLNGGEISGNTAEEGGGVYVQSGFWGGFDGGTFGGNLVITANKANSLGGGVYLDTSVSMYDIKLGGRVRISDNSGMDCYYNTEPGGTSQGLSIQDDLDTSAENHAWIGICSLPSKFEGSSKGATFIKTDKAENYSVCFFGTNGFEIPVRTADHNFELRYKQNLTCMTLNTDALKDTKGEILSADDYECSYDKQNYTYTVRISHDKDINVDENGIYVKADSSLTAEANEITLKKSTSSHNDEDKEKTYTFEYVCNNARNINGTDLTRRTVYTVNIIVSDHEVVFHVNDPAYSSKEIPSQIVHDKGKIQKPEYLEDGEWMMGWFDAEDPIDEFDFETPIMKDTLLLGIWIPKTTSTPTATPTVTATPTATATPTVTAAPTATATPTITAEPTITVTPSVTATTTPTPDTEPTEQVTPTVTPTSTPEPSEDITEVPDNEPTSVPEPTAAVTEEPTLTPTSTPEPEEEITATPSLTPTSEPKPTVEVTDTPAISPTVVPDDPEPTVTPTAIPTEKTGFGMTAVHPGRPTATPVPTEEPSVDPDFVPDKTPDPEEVPANGADLGLTSGQMLYIAPEPIQYKMLDGENCSWTKGDADPLVFRSEASYDIFVSVKIDGAEIDSSDYTSEEGSTVIKLLPSYLETLDIAEHTIEILSKDGSARTRFLIKAKTEPAPDKPNTPQTGDNGRIFLWSGVLIISAAAIGGLTIGSKKKKRKD